MNEDDEQLLDDSFAEQLKQLAPADASLDVASKKSLSVESLLFQAGYRAGSSVVQRSPAVGTDARRWFPVLAASLLTALLTLPAAYRFGRQSAASGLDRTAQQADSSRAESDIPSPSPQSQPDSERDSEDQPSPEDGQDWESNRPSIVQPIEPLDLLNVARLWSGSVPDREAPSETLTAFDSRLLDSLPRSNWIALEDDMFVPNETISAGDLDKVTATLGIQVNQR